LIALTQIIAFVKGYWYSIITAPLAYWVFGVNIFHDASHFAYSKGWRVNDFLLNVGFLFCTPYVWYHQHVIAHHSFPNVHGLDPDLYHIPKMNRHSSDLRLKKPHKFQVLTFPLIWIIAVPVGLMWNGLVQALFKPKFNRAVHFAQNEHLNTDLLWLRYSFYAFLVHVVPFLLHGLCLKGFLFAIVPIYVLSVCFMISSQINHLTPHTHEKFSKNFFIHQILTSHNVATGSYPVYLFTGGLNMQIEHHLFPSVNHCHLHKIQPMVRDLCKKHGIKYSESESLWEAIKLHVAHLEIFQK